jgi:phosphopantetheinyl transferase (holo-ACP synthase)
MPDLHFSLSHTDRCALIAVRTSWPVGVDIERLRDLPDAKILASRWFTELENKALTTLSGTSLKKAFFDLWTHREAVLKALGVDSETGVRGLEFSLGLNGSVRLVSWRGDREIARAWRVRRLRSGLDYRAALATLRHRVNSMFLIERRRRPCSRGRWSQKRRRRERRGRRGVICKLFASRGAKSWRSHRISSRIKTWRRSSDGKTTRMISVER